jgi:predicted O-methyltransferase YrrM
MAGSVSASGDGSVKSARKAIGLARGLARDRTRYFALRHRPFPVVADDALRALGVEPTAEDLRGWERARDELLPRLAELARAEGADVIADKLGDPGHRSHENKRLMYLLVRATRPALVVETGTFAGVTTTFLLRALAEADAGVLLSFDLPARRPIPMAVEHALPAGRDPGWIVPDELRDRLELVFGDTRRTLVPALSERGAVDMFVHDSLHTLRHMLFEFRTAWRVLAPSGFLVSDDVFWNAAFWWFTRTRRVPFVHIGDVGITRKGFGPALAPAQNRSTSPTHE